MSCDKIIYIQRRAKSIVATYHCEVYIGTRKFPDRDLDTKTGKILLNAPEAEGHERRKDSDYKLCINWIAGASAPETVVLAILRYSCYRNMQFG